jgi:hypothetical protein
VTGKLFAYRLADDTVTLTTPAGDRPPITWRIHLRPQEKKP